MLERAARGDPEQRGGPRPVVGAEHLDELRRGPHVVRAPPRPRCRRRAPRRSRPPRCAGRATRKSQVSSRDRRAERMAGRPPPVQVRPRRAARCRTASSRSAARPSRRRRSSGRSRRRAGRRSRRAPSPRRSARPSRGASASPVRAWWRSRCSSAIDGGNFGAPPNPPRAGSYVAASARTDGELGLVRRACLGQLRGHASARPRGAATSRWPAISTSARRSRQVRSTACSTSGTTASRGAAAAGSTCRRRTARRRA